MGSGRAGPQCNVHVQALISVAALVVGEARAVHLAFSDVDLVSRNDVGAPAVGVLEDRVGVCP